MRQAYGFVYASGVVGIGSDNFDVRKEGKRTYYIDSDVFKDTMPVVVITPRSFYANARGRFDSYWNTGTIKVVTGFSEDGDCDFSFIAINEAL